MWLSQYPAKSQMEMEHALKSAAPSNTQHNSWDVFPKMKEDGFVQIVTAPTGTFIGLTEKGQEFIIAGGYSRSSLRSRKNVALLKRIVTNEATRNIINIIVGSLAGVLGYYLCIKFGWVSVP